MAKRLRSVYPNKIVRIMFQDEAGFGRISKPKYCWCTKDVRPESPCHHIREYKYVYGAVEPKTGENFFLVMPYCDTNNMNVFLEELSEELAKIDTDKIFIIGGAMLYKTMLPYCEKAYVTKVFANGEATLYFENLDISPDWTIESREDTVEDNGYTIQYYVYKNNNVKKF